MLLPVFEVLIEDSYAIRDLRTRLGSAPDLIIDLGAHVGSAAVAMGRSFPDAAIRCYEPSSAAVRWLRANLEGNNLRSEVFPVAVTDKSGVVPFWEESPGSCGNSVMESRSSKGRSGACIQVESVSFDSVMANVETPCLLKMDIEGSEYAIIAKSASMSWKSVVAVLLEYHSVDGSCGFQKISRDLLDRGLVPLWHRANPEAENLGVALFVRSDGPF